MSVEQKIKEHLVAILDVDLEELTDDAFLTDDLGADPYDMESILETLNEEFDIDLTEDDLDGLDTVSDLIATVVDKLD